MNARIRLIPLVLASLGLAVAVVALADGHSASSHRVGDPRLPSAQAAARVHRRARRVSGHRSRRARAARSPGSLPQTRVRPPAGGAALAARMADLWRAVQSGLLAAAVPAFFPRGAYIQLKAIPSAASDWQSRLLHDFGLDIRAAHALLGRHASEARLVSVEVPESYAHWVPPGVCFNSIGYYEVPNARVLYRAGGHIRSFGIASMISWRGAWYVVHLGAILRSSDTGKVDEPSTGRGVSRYSGTC